MSVDVDTVALDHGSQVSNQPAACLGIPQVEESLRAFSQQPIGMFTREPSSRRHTFRLKPHKKTHPQAVYGVGQRTQATRKGLRLHKPVSYPIGPATCKPACVEPERVHGNILLRRERCVLSLIVFRSPIAVVELPPGHDRHRNGRQASSRTRCMMGKQKCTQQVIYFPAQWSDPSQKSNKMRGVRIRSPG